MSYLDDRTVDHWTLLQVFERASLHFECGRCWRIAEMDLQPLVNRSSIDATLATLQARLVCLRCQSRDVRMLVRIRGLRGDRAWRPHPPRAGR